MEINNLSMNEKIWRVKKPRNTEKSTQLAQSLGVSPFISQLLVNNGIESFEAAKAYFRPSLDDLHDPLLMKDMAKAVKRVLNAVHLAQKIMVYGDYDVDGTTSVSMMYSFLRSLEVPCIYYIPDRYKEGYGVSEAGILSAAEQGCKLIITLDCGIKAHDRVDQASELGIDVIVCDHHKADLKLPAAYAVLDPQRSDCTYPCKALSGCGVGFKLIHGIVEDQGMDYEILFQYLDLVAISIGADIVPITGENRILAAHGLKRLQVEQRPGIESLFASAKFNKKTITISDLVFILAPRINAAGRIQSATTAVELLISNSREEADKISETIEGYNTDRKEKDKETTVAAMQAMSIDPWYTASWSSTVKGSGWHKGVIGIVASRLIETYYKPTIVLTESKGMLVGSARSIEGLDIHQALEQCSHLLEQFGGHAMAAGMTMKIEKFEAFRMKFDEAVRSLITEEMLIPVIEIDQALAFDDITTRSYKILRQFAPFGPGNMKPIFLSRKCVDTSGSRTVGADHTHLKLEVKQEHGMRAMQGIGFKLGKHITWLNTKNPVDLVYTLEENEWRDKVSLQLQVQDMKKHQEPVVESKIELAENPT
jgi:single-stranded-DNA-specific exonuclease